MNLFDFSRQLGQQICLTDLSGGGVQATVGDAKILFPTNPHWLPLRGVGETKLQALTSLASLIAVGALLGEPEPGISALITEGLTVPTDWSDHVVDQTNDET